MRFDGLEIEGKLLELAGDKVLGELLMLLLVGSNGKKGFDMLVEVEVVVVKGLVRLGDEDIGEVESVSPPEVDDLGLSL